MNPKFQQLILEEDESFGFRDRALPLLKRGICVVPLAPKGKNPIIDDWPNMASSNPKQVELWNARWPDANVGCVATMGKCYLDDDTGDLKERIERETGKKFPHTYTVLTSVKKSGKRGNHYYFESTPQSIELGNAKLAGAYDFQENNKQVVGAYSVHPSGVVYTPADPRAPITPIPDWLVKWMKENCDAAQPQQHDMDGQHPVDADFDFPEFCDHYGLQLTEGKSGKFFLACPYKGDWHTNDGKKDVGATCILFDGSRVGFKCLSTNCEGSGKSFGQLIQKLNETHEPYLGVIWPEREDASVDWAEIDWLDVNPEAREVQPGETPRLNSDGKLYVETPSGKEEVRFGEAAAQEAQAVAQQDDPLAFPEECLEGDKLGDIAKELLVPLGVGYPAILACASVQPNLERMCGARINIYCALIVRPGGCKNETIRRAILASELVSGEDYSKSAPGGDQQLVSLLGDHAGKKRGDPRVPGPKKLLLVTNEIGDVLAKTGIDNSTLASRLCDFWDDSEYQKTIGKELVTVNCRLSWLGGLPASWDKPDKFRELFGSQTNFGLYPRFIFGYSGTRFNFRDWEPTIRPTSEQTFTAVGNEDEAADAMAWTNNNRIVVVQRISGEAQALWEAWEPSGTPDDRGRIKYNGKKVAILKACFNGETEVSLVRMQQAILFMGWQVKIREVFRPGEAKESNKEAWFTERLLPCLERAGAAEKFTEWRRISLNNRWDEKVDAGVQLRTVENLIKLGRLIGEPDEEGEKKRKYPKVKLRLLGRVS